MAHFHAAPFTPRFAGDNGICRCDAHAAAGLRRADACTLRCHMCERMTLIMGRIAKRGNGLPLAGEERAIQARKRAAG